tara:strand:+ start:2107 stop:2616 length:510 start_codon:yes stop_codon:yes gene_type:complete
MATSVLLQLLERTQDISEDDGENLIEKEITQAKPKTVLMALEGPVCGTSSAYDVLFKPKRRKRRKTRRQKMAKRQRKKTGPALDLEALFPTSSKWEITLKAQFQQMRAGYYDKNRDRELQDAKAHPLEDPQAQKVRLRRINNKWLQNFSVWKQRTENEVLRHLLERATQ